MANKTTRTTTPVSERRQTQTRRSHICALTLMRRENTKRYAVFEAEAPTLIRTQEDALKPFGKVYVPIAEAAGLERAIVTFHTERNAGVPRPEELEHDGRTGIIHRAGLTPSQAAGFTSENSRQIENRMLARQAVQKHRANGQFTRKGGR